MVGNTRGTVFIILSSLVGRSGVVIGVHEMINGNKGLIQRLFVRHSSSGCVGLGRRLLAGREGVRRIIRWIGVGTLSVVKWAHGWGD